MQRTTSSSFEADPTSNEILDRRLVLREKEMKWSALSKLKIVGEESIVLLQKFNDADEKNKSVLLEKRGLEILVPLIDFVYNITSTEMAEYIITVLGDVLELNPKIVLLIPTVVEQQSEKYPTPFSPFLKRLDHTSSYVTHQVARVITTLVNAGIPIQDDEFASFLRWARTQISTESDRLHASKLALSALAVMVRTPSMRSKLMNDHATIRVLNSVLDPKTHVQVVYQALFVLWVTSFDKEAVRHVDLHGLVLASILIILEGPKEKVLRMGFGFLKNLVQNLDEEKSIEIQMLMISHKLLPIVENLSRQTGEQDEELMADVEFFVEKLRACFEHMSSFDEYVTEVRSGKLEWSPVHRSQRFWRENAVKLNDHKHEILKSVVIYLDKEDDPVSVAVAIHDCGEYVSNYPFGRKILEELGAKTKIMLLMEHENASIKYEALITVQKMISDNWEFLGQQTNKIASSD
eukprot:m.16216 g.16216  ORF g.16216 m.16216 type:complete len:464 (-) comp4584_c0_seq1:1825-3216(-)